MSRILVNGTDGLSIYSQMERAYYRISLTWPSERNMRDTGYNHKSYPLYVKNSLMNWLHGDLAPSSILHIFSLPHESYSLIILIKSSLS